MASAFSNQEVIRLLIDTGQGQQVLAELQKKLGQVDAGIVHLTSTMATNGASAEVNAQNLQRLVDRHKELDSATRALEGGFKLTGGAARSLGYVFQDLAQGGLGGILNNIQPLIEQLGGNAGLAALLSSAGVAAFLALPALKALWASLAQEGDPALNTFRQSVTALDKTIKELTEKPHKLSVDYHNLDAAEAQVKRMKETLDKFEALANKKTTLQQGVAKAVEEAVVEHAGQGDQVSGAAKVQAAVVDALTKSGEAKTLVPGFAQADQLEADATRRLAEAAKIHDLQVKRATEAAAELIRKDAATVRATAEGALKDLAKQYTDGTETNRAKLEALLKASPRSFAGQGIDVEEFGGAIGGASAANVRAARDAQDDQEFQKYLADLEKKERDYQDARRKAEERRAKQGKTQHDQAVNQEAARFDDSTKELLPTVLESIKVGQSDEDLTKKLTAYYRDLLKDKVKPDLLAETAAKLAARAVTQGGEAVVKRQVDAEQANPGKGPVGRDLAARQLLAEARAKELDQANRADDRAAKLGKETPEQRAARVKAEKDKAEDFALHKTLDDPLAASYAEEAGTDTTFLNPADVRRMHKTYSQGRDARVFREMLGSHHGDEAAARAATNRFLGDTDKAMKAQWGKARKAAGGASADPAQTAAFFKQMLMNQRELANNQAATAMSLQELTQAAADTAKGIRKVGRGIKQQRQSNLPMGGF